MNERPRNREAFDEGDYLFLYANTMIVIITTRSLINMTILITAGIASCQIDLQS